MPINNVIYNNTTLIDISDTTANASNVARGRYFYTAAGTRTEGTGLDESELIPKSDIVNNTVTNDSTKVASAAVAKSLQDQIGTVPSGSTLQGQIDTLNSKISNYVTVGNFGKEQTLAGNSSNAVDIPITTPTGYINLLAIPIDSGAASCFVRSASFTSSTNVRCYVDNVGPTSRTPTVRVAVLFYKGA